LEEVAAANEGPTPPRAWEHNSRRHLVRIVPPVPGLWTSYVHSACVCNEIVSACNRVLGRVPMPTNVGLKSLRREARRLAAICGHVNPLSLEDSLSSFTGTRKRRYQEAYDSLVLRPISHDDARINSFVKAEKTDPFAKVNPDPRMIQARDPRYNLVVAKYLRPIEHYIYHLKGDDGLRCVAKGLNQRERADLFLRKWARFDVPVCFSIDCSRWDKHVTIDVLRVEHLFYRLLVPHCPEFDRLLSWQELNKCRTAGGVKYTVYGGRMSGDINTALGNCLLMVLMVRAAMVELGCKYTALDDGDDCLIIVEEIDFERLNAELPAKFLQFGQELKIENIARKPSDVLFCQARLAHNGIHPLFVRDWRKVLSNGCCGTKHWADPNLVRPMFGLVGTCELALNAGVPILQAYGEALIRMSRGRMASMLNAEAGLKYRVSLEFGENSPDAMPRVVTARARRWFERAFGVPEWQQIEIERILSAWDLDDERCQDLPLEWDSSWTDRRSTQVLFPEIF